MRLPHKELYKHFVVVFKFFNEHINIEATGLGV